MPLVHTYIAIIESQMLISMGLFFLLGLRLLQAQEISSKLTQTLRFIKIDFLSGLSSSFASMK